MKHQISGSSVGPLLCVCCHRVRIHMVVFCCGCAAVWCACRGKVLVVISNRLVDEKLTNPNYAFHQEIHQNISVLTSIGLSLIFTNDASCFARLRLVFALFLQVLPWILLPIFDFSPFFLKTSGEFGIIAPYTPSLKKSGKPKKHKQTHASLEKRCKPKEMSWDVIKAVNIHHKYIAQRKQNGV